ncbi:helix-turn-helix transcriptional regulator [Haloarcula amylolytica]|uniref:helix-turn-helix transcriptional regulator n=1 Tax=Haloarcula amylolytica TaxID=396317 RepID=UPI003C74F51D
MRSIDDIRQMVRLVVASLVLVLLLGSGAAPPAVSQPTDESVGVQTPDRFDRTTFQVTLYQNGSARWAIIHRTPLENDTEQQQFEDFAAEFERSEQPLYQNFVEQSTLLTQYGTNVTGRNMSATDYDRSATVDPLQNTGTVSMSFHWRNFAAVEGDSVVVSDVFDGGFYIGSSQSFVFERGPGMAFADVQPEPDSQSAPDSLENSDSVTWNGEQSFNDRRPYVELEPRETGQNTETERGTTAAADAPDGSSGGPSWMLPAVVIFIALVAGGAAAWRSGALGQVLGTDDDEPPASTPSAAADTEQPSSAPSGDATADTDTPDEPAVPDEELLTDSDRVRKLLEENGGRMKQVDIVDSTDWSKSKVSMLLSDMEDDGDISKLRVGRENIISLAGQEPDAAGSPFDDE